ncbi:MAG: hypothetical protein VYE22_17070 [Myxococcota bacterium]|nr:hypothetical protein [Myxococcota bacterium]
MTRSASALALVLSLSAPLYAACEGGEGAPPVTPSDMVDAEQPRAVPVDTVRRTTRGDIAARNLDAQIVGLREHLGRNPGDPALRGRLVDLLLMRTAYLGRFSDFDEADALTAEGLVLHADTPAAHVSRAAFLSAVHRFTEALDALDRAEALGSDPASLERSRVSISVALGVDPEATLARAEALSADAPTFANRTTLANALAAAGRFEEADAVYVDALAEYRDVSPFPVAFVSFARGVMWAEMADEPELALALYGDATSRLPDYVVANVHLAELESERARLALARDRLARLVDRDDPEPAGLLSELTEDAGERDDLVAIAAARYERLLSSHRAAFLDHGSEFFAGPGGDPERALAMATENLEARRNGRAYVVAIEAALAADRPDTACEFAAEAEAARRFHPVLDHLVADLACE